MSLQKSRNRENSRSKKSAKRETRAEAAASTPHDAEGKFKKEIAKISYKTAGQKKFGAAIRANDLTFGTGAYGTGKTCVASYEAAKLLVDQLNKEGPTSEAKIICCRPIIEAAGEKIGTLPGDKDEKTDPWFVPIKEELSKFLTKTATEYFIKSGRIEFVPIAFIRGRTFSNSVMILDEAQNTTPAMMELFLSRAGEGTKIVVTGDLRQKDLPGKSGLEDAIDRFIGFNGVGIVEFSDNDIVRSGFCRTVIEAYRK